MSETIYYQCQRCTNYCRWPGFVRVGDTEITAIAAHLGLDETDIWQNVTCTFDAHHPEKGINEEKGIPHAWTRYF